MAADLPPSSRCTFFTVDAACAMISRPTWVEPVKVTMSTAGSVVMSLPPSMFWSMTTFRTPGGRPAASAASPNSMAESGVRGLGRSTTEQPAMSAGSVFQMFR